MVDAEATVALETLRNLLIQETMFLYNDDDQVEVRRQLRTMHRFLKEADKRRDYYNPEMVRDWVSNLLDLSAQADEVLQRYAKLQSKRQVKTLKKRLKRFNCMLSETSDLHQTGNGIEDIRSISDYPQIADEIKLIRSRMADLTKRAESVTKIGESSSNWVDDDVTFSRKIFDYESEQYFVGRKDDKILLESLLTSSDERVVSICGMGGLGKTSLAAKIYRGEAAQRRFDVRAWVCISQQFQLKNVLQELLKQFLPYIEDQKIIREMEENELQRNLFAVQDEKKCLVVVDDIWEADP